MTSAFRVLSSGAVLTALVISYSESHLLIGLVGAIPLLAKGAQLFAPKLLQLVGARRLTRVAAWGERCGYIGAALAGMFGVPHTLAIILAGFAVGTLSGALYDIALTALSVERIGAEDRGRFFGARVHFSCLFAVVTAILAGVLVDAAEDRDVLPTVARGGAILLGVIPAMFAMFALRRFGAQPVVPDGSDNDSERDEGASMPAGEQRVEPDRRVMDRPFRAILLFAAVWGFSTGLTSRHVDAFALKELEFSVGLLTILTGAIVGAGVIGARTWGRMGDQFGARPILLASTCLTALNPLWYAVSTPAHPWPYVAGHIMGGIANAGWAIGVPLLILNAPLRRSGERLRMLAVFQATVGVAAGLAPIVGGLLLEQLARFGGHMAYFTLFMVTAVIRLLAVWLLRGLPSEGSRRTWDAAVVMWRVQQMRLSGWRASSERALAPFRAPF